MRVRYATLHRCTVREREEDLVEQEAGERQETVWLVHVGRRGGHQNKCDYCYLIWQRLASLTRQKIGFLLLAEKSSIHWAWGSLLAGAALKWSKRWVN